MYDRGARNSQKVIVQKKKKQDVYANFNNNIPYFSRFLQERSLIFQVPVRFSKKILVYSGAKHNFNSFHLCIYHPQGEP